MAFFNAQKHVDKEFRKQISDCYSLHSVKVHDRMFKAMDTFCMRLSDIRMGSTFF